jgi:hypothetical protein
LTWATLGVFGDSDMPHGRLLGTKGPNIETTLPASRPEGDA